MTDAHCHLPSGEPGLRELLCRTPEEASGCVSSGDCFAGVHPWESERWTDARRDTLRDALAANPRLGVGEIGLDRLRSREIPPVMRAAFAAQLELAAEFGRPVVLHGAKCWGEVVRAVAPHAGRIPAMLFHGFSRSDGLIPEIVRLGGYLSVGPQLLNDHAVNYRELAKRIPADRLLVETDRTTENAATCPSVVQVAAFLSRLRGESPEALARQLDENARRFKEP